jgi:hypothetical protein
LLTLARLFLCGCLFTSIRENLKDLFRMISNLLLIEARVLNLIFELLWQAMKLTGFLVDHYSILAFRLILQLQLRGITSLLDDGSVLALLNSDYVRGPLLLFRPIPIIFRLVTLVRVRRCLFAALDDLSQLKNDI